MDFDRNFKWTNLKGIYINTYSNCIQQTSATVDKDQLFSQKLDLFWN